MLSIPDDFVWGAATSCFQIEGATRTDGRGESIWDRFCATPGKVSGGATGEGACDHYHHWPEDIALMRDLGLQAYRFSIAWPRIFPSGTETVNEAGLDFYDRLVDALLEANLEPFVTLFHWDLPQQLEDKGGWVSRDTAHAFVNYADVVSRRLGDRVENWITHNEPWCMSMLGYQQGLHAPGRRDWPAALKASHHLLLSHGMAVPVLRRNCRDAEVGITLNLTPAVPASPSEEDYEACRHFDGYFNRWFLDPVFGRHYPADMIADYEKLEQMPKEGIGSFVHDGDLDIIAARNDFLGINYYNRHVARSERIPEEHNQPRTVLVAPKEEWTDMGWEVYPEGLAEILTRVHLEYRPQKIYITENGASYSTGPNGDGRIHDHERIRFIRDHLLQAVQAMDNGVPLAGYFVWSLLDNFEWERGYDQRFGITWVDYETQQRTPKDSALWYRDVVKRGAITP